MIATRKAIGRGILNKKQVAVLEAKFKPSSLLKTVHAGVHDKSVDNPDRTPGPSSSLLAVGHIPANITTLTTT